jgi:hypothetical protein
MFKYSEQFETSISAVSILYPEFSILAYTFGFDMEPEDDLDDFIPPLKLSVPLIDAVLSHGAVNRGSRSPNWSPTLHVVHRIDPHHHAPQHTELPKAENHAPAYVILPPAPRIMRTVSGRDTVIGWGARPRGGERGY